MKIDQTRRDILRNAAVCAAAAAAVSTPGSLLVLPVSAKEAEKEPEVTATEVLMREHGVIRRALLVYFETVPRLRQNPASVDPTALRQTAQLFRTFGEDYHERMLEEQHIFPLVRKQGGELQRDADILTTQHNRGARSPIMCSRFRMVRRLAPPTPSRWRRCSRVLSLCTKITRRARTRLFFRHGKRTSRTSNSMKFPISSRISSTRCSAKTALTMQRRRSAASKERWALPISHSSLHRRPRRRKINC